MGCKDAVSISDSLHNSSSHVFVIKVRLQGTEIKLLSSISCFMFNAKAPLLFKKRLIGFLTNVLHHILNIIQNPQILGDIIFSPDHYKPTDGSESEWQQCLLVFSDYMAYFYQADCELLSICIVVLHVVDALTGAYCTVDEVS